MHQDGRKGLQCRRGGCKASRWGRRGEGSTEGEAHLRASRAGGVFRELLNDRVPQQVEAVDDSGCESQHLHTQQVDAIPDIARTQVQGVGNTHIHVEDEGADVEGHSYPAIPMYLSLQPCTQPSQTVSSVGVPCVNTDCVHTAVKLRWSPDGCNKFPKQHVSQYL